MHYIPVPGSKLAKKIISVALKSRVVLSISIINHPKVHLHCHETCMKEFVKFPSNYAKSLVRAFTIFKIFPGVIPPDPRLWGKGRGRRGGGGKGDGSGRGGEGTGKWGVRERGGVGEGTGKGRDGRGRGWEG